MSELFVNSEIGTLKKVILHPPGKELEAMTPSTALELLYDDILYLPAAQEQHAQLAGVLEKVASVYYIRNLLEDILRIDSVKAELLNTVCRILKTPGIRSDLMKLSPEKLAETLILGVRMKHNTLERFLSTSKYLLPPLPNLFFTRDSAMVVNGKVIVGNMANRIRQMEAILNKFIFTYHPQLQGHEFFLDATLETTPDVTFEGGDILVLREDTVAIGMSERTSIPGIDFLLEQFKSKERIRNVFVVILPKDRASIHLDMVFTMVDWDKAVVYPPLLLTKKAVDVIQVDLSNSKAPQFTRHDFLLDALKTVGINLNPILCGGHDEWTQQREQWQSGANFFTMAPGKMIGYGMNKATFEELGKAGIPRLEATDIIAGKINLDHYDKYAVAISGNELNRGGGGCRCMTMPVLREKIDF